MREEVRRKGIGGVGLRGLMLARCNHEGILPQMLGKVEELLSRGEGAVGGGLLRGEWIGPVQPEGWTGTGRWNVIRTDSEKRSRIAQEEGGGVWEGEWTGEGCANDCGGAVGGTLRLWWEVWDGGRLLLTRKA